MQISGTICTNDGKKIIGEDNNPKDLIGHWKFDDAFGIDSSNYKNHLNSPHEVGPEAGY